MQCIKETADGSLYIQNMYSYGVIPKQNSVSRQQRKAITTEHKQKINSVNRKYNLMRLMCKNFVAGRDLFVCFGYDYEPTPEQVKTSLKNLHRKLKNYMKRRGVTYKYIVVTEEHSSDDEPCRIHHHIIMSGCSTKMLGKLIDMWGQGSIDVRMLRELTENFENTCDYLLKEKKDSSRRAYSTSHNLVKPDEPVRRIVSDNAIGAIPPGVKVVKSRIEDNGFGRYEIHICKIIDEKLFNDYFSDVKKIARRQTDLRHYITSKYR